MLTLGYSRKAVRSLTALPCRQTYLDRWEHTWADTRIQGTTKRQVAVMFSEELPHLQPRPLASVGTSNPASRRHLKTGQLRLQDG